MRWKARIVCFFLIFDPAGCERLKGDGQHPRHADRKGRLLSGAHPVSASQPQADANLSCVSASYDCTNDCNASRMVGDACWIHNVEAAIFPADTRPILGMSVLRRLAPFNLSDDPATPTLNKRRPSSSTAAAVSIAVPASRSPD